MSDELRILIVEDVPLDAKIVEQVLRKAGLVFKAERVDTREGLERALEAFKPDVVLADYSLPTFTGGEALEIVLRVHPEVPVIIVSGVLGDEAAVELVHQGAKDYVLKNNLIRLDYAIRRALATEMSIRARKTAERESRIAEEKYRALFIEASDGIVLIDGTGLIVDCNPEFERQTGRTLNQLMQIRIGELCPADKVELAEMKFREIWSAGTGGTSDLAFQKPDGEIIPIEFRTTTITIADKRYLQSISRDISERKKMEDQVHQLAFYDALTKLPNRILLNDRFNQTMAASKRSGCYGAGMFVDLDNFKPLNDTYGHGVGDLLLIEVADRLKSCVREMDTVARFGGDEFVVILGDLNTDKIESTSQAKIVAEKIRAALAEPYVLKIQHVKKTETTVEYNCTASIGVALFINHEASQDDILKWADMAMYQAKEAGRDLIRFYDSKA